MNSRLRENLRLRDEQLLKNTEYLVAKATPQLWHTLSTFPSGTKHTPEHTETVEAIAGQLLPDPVLEAMHPDELALLILSCHYHDLGMAGTEADNATAEGREQVRQEHAISVGERISDRWQELGFENQNYAEVLAEVCRGHRPTKNSGVASWDTIPEFRNLGPARFVRPRLVSAMIYAADELHLGDDRAPKREEDWKQIRNAESLRHWRRHQSVAGPSRPVDAICFDVRVDTVTFERDIRRTFHKALLAVADLKRELSTAGIAHPVSDIRIQWIRDSLWKLLIVGVSRDGLPRSKRELRDAVKKVFDSHAVEFEDLTALCKEFPQSSSELELPIDRSISDLISRSFLAEKGSQQFCLSSSARAAEYILGLTREADKTERLFGRSIDAHHEHRFYESSTGKEFIRNSVFPHVKSSYAVDIAKMPPESALRALIESSPTSCRVLQHISTPPSTLVKHDLLQIAVTAGVCFDIMGNPELLLDKSFRSAVREAFSGTTARLPRFLTLMRELAIVKNFTFDQVADIVVSPDGISQNSDAKADQSPSLNISQQLPRERPEWALSYIMLAGQRAKEPVTILSTPEAPLTVKPGSLRGTSAGDIAEDLSHIEISPSMPGVSRIFSLRASFQFDSTNNRVTFICHKLQECRHLRLPVIVTMAFADPVGALDIKFTFIRTELTVLEAEQLQQAAEASGTKALETVLQSTDGKSMGSTVSLAKWPFDKIVKLQSADLARIADVDPSIPLPCIADPTLLDEILKGDSEQAPGRIGRLRHSQKEEKPSVTTVFLRFANDDGEDYREEYLGNLDIGRHFSPPQLRGGTISQEEVNQIWSLGETDCKMTMLFREDPMSLADNLRKWMNDRTTPFPFENGGNEGSFHFCRSRLEMEHLRHVDRLWYIERPVIFRMCPASLVEQYQVEMKHWEDSGDLRRSEVLAELLAEEESRQRSRAKNAGKPE